MYSLDVSTEGGRFGNTCMASLGSYGAPIQTQCQYPPLKRDPLLKVKRSLVRGGFCFCCHYIDISKAASPVTFLGKKLSACKPQGVISHGVISIIFDLFVYCLPVLVNAQWATSPPPRAHRALPAGFRDTEKCQRSHGTSAQVPLVQRGQARGQGRAQARDPPWPGTLALTFTQRHEKAAEALGSRMEEQSGRCSPEAALQQWKIFSSLVSEEKSVTHPTRLRQVLGRGAASKCSSPVPLDCVHSPSSLEKNLSPVLPILWQGLAVISQATKPGKVHGFMPWGDAVPLVCLCLPAGPPHKPTLDSQGREGK